MPLDPIERCLLPITRPRALPQYLQSLRSLRYGGGFDNGVFLHAVRVLRASSCCGQVSPPVADEPPRPSQARAALIICLTIPGALLLAWTTARGSTLAQQPQQCATRTLVRLCRWPRRRPAHESALRAPGFASSDAVRGFFVTTGRSTRRIATHWDRQHPNRPGFASPGDLDLIAGTDAVSRLHALAVQMHAPARHCVTRQGTTLVEARAPQPFIDTRPLAG